MNDAQRHVLRTRNALIRPALAAAVGLTVYGNLAQAQPSVGGWLSHGWAPLLYLVLVEILVRRGVGGAWLPPVLIGFVLLALVAGIVSFTSLTVAAQRWGWRPGEAWLFPVIVDLTAVLLTLANMGAGARVRELADRVPSEPSGGRPRQPNSVRETAKRKRAERQAEPPRTDPNSIAERILAEFGPEPNDWPQATALAERFGCSKSTASAHRRKALNLVSSGA